MSVADEAKAIQLANTDRAMRSFSVEKAVQVFTSKNDPYQHDEVLKLINSIYNFLKGEYNGT